MVPGVGLEPTRCCHRGILSPLRLPISPPGHVTRWAFKHLCWLIILPVFQTGLAVATGVLPNATLEHPAHRLPISPPGHVTRWAFKHLCWLIILPVFQTGLAVATGVLPNATLEHPAHRLPISPPGSVTRWAFYSNQTIDRRCLSGRNYT